jgi:hypothetical protein
MARQVKQQFHRGSGVETKKPAPYGAGFDVCEDKVFS